MTPDDIDKIEIWFVEWYAYERTLSIWPRVRDKANRIMDDIALEIQRLRAQCPEGDPS
jgi:hypothetical protein